MIHQCLIKSVVMWLHILVVSLLLCVCRTVCNCFVVLPQWNDLIFT